MADKPKSRGSAKLGNRALAVRVKTAKSRDLASTLWLERQLNDPYVQEAKKLGYRSRAAFKLAQLDDKCRLLKPGMRIVEAKWADAPADGGTRRPPGTARPLPVRRAP